MACVIPTLIADNRRHLAGKNIRDFPFSFITPLCTYNNNSRQYITYSLTND
jgi:hypothetical protein